MQPLNIATVMAFLALFDVTLARDPTCGAVPQPPSCGGGILSADKCIELCECGGPDSGIGLSCFNSGSCSSANVLFLCQNVLNCRC